MQLLVISPEIIPCIMPTVSNISLITSPQDSLLSQYFSASTMLSYLKKLAQNTKETIRLYLDHYSSLVKFWPRRTSGRMITMCNLLMLLSNARKHWLSDSDSSIRTHLLFSRNESNNCKSAQSAACTYA